MKKLLTLTIVSSLTLGWAFAQKGKVNTAEYNLMNGEVYKAKENIDQAFSDESMANWAKAWFVKGDVYRTIYESKDMDQALYSSSPNALSLAKEAYLKAFELEEKPKKKASVKDGLHSVGAYFYNEGIGSYSKNDWEGAYSKFNEALRISEFLYENNLSDTPDTNAYYVVLLSSYNTQRLDQAQKAGEKLLSLNTDRPDVYNVLISVYQQNGEDSKYEKTLNTARTKFPGDGDILFHEINFYLKKGELDKLEGKLQQALKIDPSNPSLYLALGNIQDKNGNSESALEMYNKAIKADPDYVEAYINIAGIYNNQANEIIEKMNNENDTKKYNLLKQERDNIFKDKMIPLLEKAHAIDSNNENVKIVLKEIYARLEMFDEIKRLK